MTKAITGEVMEPDLIAVTVHEIEALKETDARALIDRLNDGAALTHLKLGGVLSLIRSKEWYTPHATFLEFCEGHGIHPRRAQRWMRSYRRLAESKVPWDQVRHLGWTKLSIISPMLTHDNAEQWIKIAGDQKTLQLVETVKNATKGQTEGPKSLEDQTCKTVTTWTFKLNADQKATIEAALQKAKVQSGTTFDTAALEFICLDFLGGAKLPSVEDRMMAVGIHATAKAFEEAFPDVKVQYELVE
jgi:hypothetical protein